MAALVCILLTMNSYGGASQQGKTTEGMPQLLKHGNVTQL